MDSMHPDPDPPLPPSLPDIRSHIQRLEASLNDRGHHLSGRIIHVCHHLPVEIIRIVPPEALESGILSPPMTPEFKPEDQDAVVESIDAKWRIHSRTAHTAMVSGIKSLSETHEQLIVAWTGEVLLQSNTNVSPRPDNPGLPSMIASMANRLLAGKEEKSPAMQIESGLNHDPKDDTVLKVFTGEFNADEKKEIENELNRFTGVEYEIEKKGKLTYVPVFVPPDVSKSHYEGFCKRTLWPLFHYLLWLDSTATVPSPDPSWIAYHTTNLLFAQKVAEVYRPGDLVIVHDYHLLLAPKMIREALEIMVGMFMHTPWPSSEIFRCLPKILEGMLGANLVSFQTYSYSRHFVSTCIRVCGFESAPGGVDANGSFTAVEYCPIGIDIDRVSRDRDSPGVRPRMENLRMLYKDKKIIVGREKLDQAKGVYNKLQAFEKFLQVYPEWRGKVVLIQVTTPALSEHPKLERMTAELVSHINGAYGSLDFTPVHHYHQAIERDEYFGLLSVADLALITSLRDGMNTTSMEFILCQDQTNKSPIVLSEFMGTAASFHSALTINPHDLLGVADAINHGLSMSAEEKAERHAALYGGVVGHTSHTWAATVLKQLLQNVGGENMAHQTPALDVGVLAEAYKKASKRLMLFDYDGTLTPIVKVPSQAIPTDRTRAVIKALAADPKNVVYLISGRDSDFLVDHWGMVPNLGLSAEHGGFIKPPSGTEFVNMTENLDMSWYSEVEGIFRYYIERTSGSTLETKKSSLTWHYRNADPDYGEFQCKQCLDLLESSLAPRRPIEVLVGKKNLEVRPLAVNKGEIVRRLMYENPDADFIFCAGDDKTDEDMFRSLRSALPAGGPKPGQPVVLKPPVAVTSTMDPEEAEQLPDVELKVTHGGIFSTTVGPPAKRTLAEWHVTCPEEVVESLESLLENEQA
ncbi:trehalose-phosphatase [Tremella mesenterica]|uniref:Trehalose-phosphatase n=1 Tax=Tremella mesenterica TaxID=5217 RepID=A0A4Q1BCB1_TREME|nr:trehalose-phosphatase [Tremella mesenterica]